MDEEQIKGYLKSCMSIRMAVEKDAKGNPEMLKVALFIEGTHIDYDYVRLDDLIILST